MISGVTKIFTLISQVNILTSLRYHSLQIRSKKSKASFKKNCCLHSLDSLSKCSCCHWYKQGIFFFFFNQSENKFQENRSENNWILETKYTEFGNKIFLREVFFHQWYNRARTNKQFIYI